MFNKLTVLECMYLSNTTVFGGSGIHVSALDIGHLQVVHEMLRRPL